MSDLLTELDKAMKRLADAVSEAYVGLLPEGRFGRK